jgi:hypothetical protein
MNTFQRCFPIADAIFTIPEDQLEKRLGELLDHQLVFEHIGESRFKVYFPPETKRIALLFTNPQQHRIVLPDGHTLTVIDPPDGEKHHHE